MGHREPGLPEDQQPTKPVTYSVVKTGLIGLTKYLENYWPDRVRCNALCLGGLEAASQMIFSRKYLLEYR
jgi:NAD(P)-dependent dehydrogenase (short-subunit alcohol dehydrogenase family)